MTEAHKEIIRCPECLTVQEATLDYAALGWGCIHECTTCGVYITALTQEETENATKTSE